MIKVAPFQKQMSAFLLLKPTVRVCRILQLCQFIQVFRRPDVGPEVGNALNASQNAQTVVMSMVHVVIIIFPPPFPSLPPTPPPPTEVFVTR